MEVVVEDSFVDMVIEKCSAARTGEIGDGKIFISPVEQVVRFGLGKESRRCLIGSEKANVGFWKWLGGHLCQSLTNKFAPSLGFSQMTRLLSRAHPESKPWNR